MRIKTSEVREGHHNETEVWICHYHRPDLHKKPLRNVPPTKAVIKSIKGLPNGKSMYYTSSCFLAYGKSGNLLKRQISPVDNTGYRSRPGTELFVFSTETECKAEWHKQIQEYIQRKDEWLKSLKDEWENEKSGLLKSTIIMD